MQPPKVKLVRLEVTLKTTDLQFGLEAATLASAESSLSETILTMLFAKPCFLALFGGFRVVRAS
jgi:hypothetical protein